MDNRVQRLALSKLPSLGANLRDIRRRLRKELGILDCLLKSRTWWRRVDDGKAKSRSVGYSNTVRSRDNSYLRQF